VGQTPARSDGQPAGAALEIAADAPAPLPILAVGALALGKLALHLATNAQYGYHRDELYYIASGNHPALGYVDYPPITPLLAYLVALLLGSSPWTLRVLPSLVGACLVILVALVARELGGGRRAQVLAAVAAATSLLLLGSNWLFMTVTFDELWWIAAIFVFARLLRANEPRLWLAIGVVLGLGLETKLTIVGLGVGLAAALIMTPLRWQLRTRWPWLGLLLAFLLWAPNLAWQQLNSWPTLEFLRLHGEVIQAAVQGSISLNFDSGGVLAFVAFQPVLIGIVTLPLWFMGWYFLLRHARWRPLGVTALVAFLLYLPVGKAYYPGPLIPLLLAAGCVQLEATVSSRGWSRAVLLAATAMVLQAVLALPILIPVMPQPSLATFGLDQARKDYADTVGWPELVAQVAAEYQQLTPDERLSTAIVAGNYGEAGAIDMYGPAFQLPIALSPHLTFWYWKPEHVDASTVIAVGVAEAQMRQYFTDVRRVGTVQSVDGVRNEEVGRAILICRQPVVPLDDAWPLLRRFF
jgi:4-amino-4-deoxy-L-arabinose transferase-like glycosyltransferase